MMLAAQCHVRTKKTKLIRQDPETDAFLVVLDRQQGWYTLYDAYSRKKRVLIMFFGPIVRRHQNVKLRLQAQKRWNRERQHAHI